MRCLAMSPRRRGERWPKLWGVSEELVTALVAGRAVSSGVAGVTSWTGGGVSPGVGVDVDALPQRKDMEKMRGEKLSKGCWDPATIMRKAV